MVRARWSLEREDSRVKGAWGAPGTLQHQAFLMWRRAVSEDSPNLHNIIYHTCLYTLNYPWKSLSLLWSITCCRTVGICLILALILSCGTDSHVFSHICTVSFTLSGIFPSHTRCLQLQAHGCLLALISGELEGQTSNFSPPTSRPNHLIPAL